MNRQIRGYDELLSAFKGLPGVYSDKLIQKVNLKAAQPLVFRAHRLAPVGETGNLADSIGAVRSKATGVLGAVEVGPRRKGGFKGFAGHLVEFGTKDRRTKSGANRGHMTPNPFMEQAYDQTIDEVLGNIDKELELVTVRYLKSKVK